MENVKQMIVKILHEEFEIKKELLENESTEFKKLGLDSLDVMDLVVMLETQSDKKIPMRAFFGVRTVGDVYQVIGQALVQETELSV